MSKLFHRILFVQTAFIGDVLLSIPTLKFLKKANPGVRIDYIARVGLGQLLLETGLVDHVIEIQKGNSLSYKKARTTLNANEPYDLVVCPHESFRTALLLRSIKSPIKASFWHWWNLPFFSLRVVRDVGLPEALRQLSLIFALYPSLKGLGEEYKSFTGNDAKKFVNPEVSMLLPIFDLFRDDLKSCTANVQNLILKHELWQYYCLFPGSVWKTKMWTQSGFAEVAQRIVASGKQVLFMGAPNERNLCSELQGQVQTSVSLCGQTSLWESAQILVCF